MKCPFSKRNMSIKEVCADKNFFLQFTNNDAKFKQKHNYYYQCQGIIAITEIEEIDFVVLTLFDVSGKKIFFQKDIWEKFYQNYKAFILNTCKREFFYQGS